MLERFLLECRKTKTMGFSLANQNGRIQPNRPIRTRSKYTQPALTQENSRVQVMIGFGFTLLIGQESGARFFSKA